MASIGADHWRRRPCCRLTNVTTTVQSHTTWSGEHLTLSPPNVIYQIPILRFDPRTMIKGLCQDLNIMITLYIGYIRCILQWKLMFIEWEISLIKLFSWCVDGGLPFVSFSDMGTWRSVRYWCLKFGWFSIFWCDCCSKSKFIYYFLPSILFVACLVWS